MKDKLKKILVMTAVAIGSVVVTGGTAMASAPPPVNADTTDVSTFTVTAPWVTLIVTALIPILNGILTKPTTAAGVKAVGTIVLNGVYSLIINGMVSDGGAVFSTETLYTFVFGMVISITGYYGLYKPINVTSNQGGRLATVGVT